MHFFLEDSSAPPIGRAKIGDAGFDIRSSEWVELHPGKSVTISTGLHVELDEDTYGVVTGRSGISSRGVFCATGTIDNGYRGEIKVILHNSSTDHYFIEKGDRIAQLIVLPLLPVKAWRVKALEDLGTTIRGTDGFGSTGR